MGFGVLRCLTSMTCLTLTDCNVSRIGIEALHGLSELHTLQLVRCNAVGDESTPALCNLQSLTSLSLVACSKVTDSGLGSLRPLGSSLTSLSLAGCAGISDSGLGSLGTMTGLRSLDVSNCDAGITNAGVAVLTNLSSLSTLRIGGCESITDQGAPFVTPDGNLCVLNVAPRLQEWLCCQFSEA